MNKIFDSEGPLFSTLGKMADLMLLNVLYLLCSLPVITIGASTTALYYVTLKMVKDEEGYIFKSFFKAFLQNFRQATLIWLIFLPVGAILLLDYLIINGTLLDVSAMPDSFRKVLLILLLVVGFLYFFTLRYVFPILARFENTIGNTIKNALLISIRHLPQTVLLLAMPVLAGVVLYFFPAALILILLILCGWIAYLSSKIFVKIFVNYMPGQDVSEMRAHSDDTDGGS